MKTVTIIYWTRALLGIVAALICNMLIGILGDINILNGISIALLVYIISYYVYKSFFMYKVEKPRQLFWTGVGAYFLTWIVFFAMFFTLLGPSLTIRTPASDEAFSTGKTVTIKADITNLLGASFSDANVTANSPTNTLIQLREISWGTYLANYTITSSDTIGEWQIYVAASIGGRYREESVTVIIEASS